MIVRDDLLNGLDGDDRRLDGQYVPEGLFREVERDRQIMHRRIGDDPVERALQLAYIRLDLACHEQGDIRRKLDADRATFLIEDRDLRLQVGRLDVRQKTPLEPRTQALFQLRDVPGRAIAGHHDLTPSLVEGIERVEELFLCSLLACEKLDVVDEQHVDGAVAVAKGRHAVEADRVDQLVDEVLGRDVLQPEHSPRSRDAVADRVHEVGLSKTRAPVDVQRIVGMGRFLGDGQRRRVGELIGIPDDERLERVARVELRGHGGNGRRRCPHPGRRALRRCSENDLPALAVDLADRLGDEPQVIIS